MSQPCESTFFRTHIQTPKVTYAALVTMASIHHNSGTVMATEKRWVIFVIPYQSVGGNPSSIYIAPDGTITMRNEEVLI
jgi:hypothetical protein